MQTELEGVTVRGKQQIRPVGTVSYTADLRRLLFLEAILILWCQICSGSKGLKA